MSHITQHTLPTHAEVCTRLPLSPELRSKIEQDRLEIENILMGRDPRKFMIIGPCSSWPSEEVVEYARRLAPLAEELQDVIKIVMRTYIQKPRTIAGWMGPLVQPDPFAEPHIPTGIFYCREMMPQVLETGLPIADEILFPRYQSYFRDLLTWAAIGARSSENQEHRVVASLLEFPIGVKNPTSGSIPIGINSVLACQTPNFMAVAENQVKTSGNPCAHLVLRGGNGNHNIGQEHLEQTVQLLQEKCVQNPSVVIDISHDNTRDENGVKQYERQTEVLWETLDIMSQNPKIMSTVKGWMAESFLEEGSQNLAKCSHDSVIPGKSVTDGCLGWDATQDLLITLAHKLRTTSS